MLLSFVLVIILLMITVHPFINETKIIKEIDLKPTNFTQKEIISNSLPITILSNQDFIDLSFPGSGTEEDPYRIENYTISTIEDNAITIKNTRKFFTIRNCSVSAYRYGIFIENVTEDSYDEMINSFSITNNTCYNCWNGIQIISSWYAYVYNNTCINNDNDGINIYSCWFSTVENNTCIENEYGLVFHKSDSFVSKNNCSFNEKDGLIIWESSGTISQNMCIKNGYGLTALICYGYTYFVNNICLNNSLYGLYLSGSSSSITSNNTCSYNGYGIYHSECFWSNIVNNTCTFNGYGIYFTQGSWYDTIANNTCANNTKDGIYVEKGRECTITHNKLMDNEGYGVYLEGRTNDSVIAYNSFIRNNPTGNSQGFDDGFRNVWYDKETKMGNYWFDLNSRSSYKIDGRAKSKDRFPLNSNLERINVSFLIIILGLLGISAILNYYFSIKQK